MSYLFLNKINRVIKHSALFNFDMRNQLIIIPYFPNLFKDPSKSLLETYESEQKKALEGALPCGNKGNQLILDFPNLFLDPLNTF